MFLLPGKWKPWEGYWQHQRNVKVGKMEIFLLLPFPIYTAVLHGAQPAKIFPEGLVGSHCWAAVPALPVNNFCLNFCRVGAGGISQIGVCLAQVWGLSLTDRHKAAALTAVKYEWLSCVCWKAGCKYNSPQRKGQGYQEHHLLCSSTEEGSAGQAVCVEKGKRDEIWMVQMLIWCLTCSKGHWVCWTALSLSSCLGFSPAVLPRLS